MSDFTPQKLTLETLRPHGQWLAFALAIVLVGASLILTLLWSG